MTLVRKGLGRIAKSRQLHTAFSRPAVCRLVLPAVKPLARWLPTTLLFDMPVSRRSAVSLHNGGPSFSFEVDPGDSISKTLFWYGLRGYEPHTVALISALAKHSSSFIDIGANIGIYSLLIASLRDDIAVHAIEPVPSVFAHLQRNAHLNSFDNLFLHQVAVSDRTGEAEINVPVGDVPLESSLLRRFRPNTQAVTVDVTTLDDFVAEAGITRVDLVKIDTEGTSHMVIAGARRTLSRDAPLLVCEILHAVDTDTTAWPLLKELGYRSFLLTSGGLVNDDEVRGDPQYRDLNYLFVHRDRVEETVSALATTPSG